MKTRAAKTNAFAARRRGGFSLIEILIVIAIIGMMAGVVVINLGGTLDNAKIEAATRFTKDGVKVPLTAYKVHVGNYPSTSEGLNALRTPPGDKAKKWKGPYVEEDAEMDDPWGNPYQYRFPGTRNSKSYDIWSWGPNGQEGGGDDIGNWKDASE